MDETQVAAFDRVTATVSPRPWIRVACPNRISLLDDKRETLGRVTKKKWRTRLQEQITILEKDVLRGYLVPMTENESWSVKTQTQKLDLYLRMDLKDTTSRKDPRDVEATDQAIKLQTRDKWNRALLEKSLVRAPDGEMFDAFKRNDATAGELGEGEPARTASGLYVPMLTRRETMRLDPVVVMAISNVYVLTFEATAEDLGMDPILLSEEDPPLP